MAAILIVAPLVWITLAGIDASLDAWSKVINLAGALFVAAGSICLVPNVNTQQNKNAENPPVFWSTMFRGQRIGSRWVAFGGLLIAIAAAFSLYA